MDLDLDTGRQVLLERFDQRIKYTIANNTCSKVQTSAEPDPMWDWLKFAFFSGHCAIDDRYGEQWTAPVDKEGLLKMGCFEKPDTPMELLIKGPSFTDMLVFNTFQPGRPNDDVFDPPSVCNRS